MSELEALEAMIRSRQQRDDPAIVSGTLALELIAEVRELRALSGVQTLELVTELRELRALRNALQILAQQRELHVWRDTKGYHPSAERGGTWTAVDASVTFEQSLIALANAHKEIHND